MIQKGMDPVRARRESIVAMRAIGRNDKEIFEGKVKARAKGIEERLLREGVAPEEARRRARTEAAERIRCEDALDTPAARVSRPIRPPRSPRPQADPDPMTLVMWCAIAGMCLPTVAFVFYVLLALLFGG